VPARYDDLEPSLESALTGASTCGSISKNKLILELE
jgi:hypothetical protein